MRKDLDGVTPTLPDVIKVLIDSSLADVRVCLPAKIVTYYPKLQYADIKPQLMGKFENGVLFELPVIPNVPVVHPRANGGKMRIHVPVQAGDDVTLLISDRSLDNWKNQGGLTNPNDRRKFNISDAIAFIGGSSQPDAFTVGDPTAIEVVNDQAKLSIFPTGKFRVENSTDELLDQIQQAISILAGASTVAGGPFIPSVVTQLQTIATKIGGLKG